MQKNNPEFVTCLNCKKLIASFQEDEMKPRAEECYAKGNIPVPNCGWFCSQNCAIQFEKTYGVKFGRTIDGMIDYYREENPSVWK